MPTCSRPADPEVAADKAILSRWDCREDWIAYAGEVFGVANNEKHWDDGFGWHAPCDVELPFARFLNACWILTYSNPNPLDESSEKPIFYWARWFVREHLNDVRVRCGDRYRAMAYRGSGELYLYPSFFYRMLPVDRAATLVHEARHLHSWSHDAEFHEKSMYEGPGADSDWESEGSWMYAASYLAYYRKYAVYATTAMRERALDRANLIVDNCFATPLGWVFK